MRLASRSLGHLSGGRGRQWAEQLAERGPALLLHSCVQALAGQADVAQPLHSALQVPQAVLCQQLFQHQAPQLRGQVGLARAQAGLLPGPDQDLGLAGCLKGLSLLGFLLLLAPATSNCLQQSKPKAVAALGARNRCQLWSMLETGCQAAVRFTYGRLMQLTALLQWHQGYLTALASNLLSAWARRSVTSWKMSESL